MLPNPHCSFSCCFLALCSCFISLTAFIPHTYYLQSFISFFPSLSCKSLHQPSCHPFQPLISHSFHTSLWLHFIPFLTFHPNSIPFTFFIPFIILSPTLLSSRPSFSYIISPASRATCTPSFPDLEKIADPTDAILRLSCILSLLVPTVESWQPQRET